MPPRFMGLGATSDLTFASSEPLIIISRSGKRFFVHRDITYDLHINADGADFSAWDDDTVGRWIQFLYAGDYQAPESVWLQDSRTQEQVSGENDDNDLTAMTTRSGANTPDTIQSATTHEGDVNVLYLHAKLYLIGYSAGPSELETVALSRLKAELDNASNAIENGDSKAATDFIELLDYISNLSALRSLDLPTDTLGLEIVTQFAARHFTGLISRQEMSSLMRQRDLFAVNLMVRIANKACETKRDVTTWKNRALAAEEKLQETQSEYKKARKSEITKLTQLWLLTQQKKILAENIPQLEIGKAKLNMDTSYHHDSICLAKMRMVQNDLSKLEEAHPALIQQFTVEKSEVIRDFVNFDAEIVEYLHLGFLSIISTFVWSTIQGVKYTPTEIRRSSSLQIMARASMGSICTFLKNVKIRLGIPEREFIAIAHKHRWIKDTSQYVSTVSDKELMNFLLCRAAWLDSYVQWMEYVKGWILHKLNEADSGPSSTPTPSWDIPESFEWGCN